MAEAKAESDKQPKKCYLLCAAIDFGTTYSGYAFSSKAEPNNIKCPQWSSPGGKGLASWKTPTSLLLNLNQEFAAFGYEAEENYTDLLDEDGHEDWYYFKHFKMKLHGEKQVLKLGLKLKDNNGKELSALVVFSTCIRYLKDHLLKSIEKRGIDIKEEEIMWVLTVPAIWNEQAKQFMRKAAEQADIPSKQLMLALEPEAASIFVTQINVNRKQSEEGHLTLSPYDPGTKFMVVDLGGGTVDITVREVMEDRSLKELYVACGNAMGGNTVNAEIYDFLIKYLEKDTMEEFKTNHPAAAYDLETGIETRKRMKESECQSGNVQIDLPDSLLETYKDIKNDDFSKSHALSVTNIVKLKKKKLNLDPSLFRSFFNKSIESIKETIQMVQSLEVTAGLKDIILVGGFADSSIIRKTLKESLPDLRFVIPDEAGLAVLKGAVIFGHNPNIVSARVSRYTFGTEVHRFFLDGDDEDKRTYVGNKPYCKGVFNKLAEVGQTFRLGEKVVTDVYPLVADMTKMSVKCYTSSEKNPKYVDDPGCNYIGKMTVDMPDITRGLDRCVLVSLTFGDTEWKLEAKDDSNGEPAHVDLDMLS